MRVACTQSTYLPWMGLFGMMDCVDTFIFLDDVQFERSSWQSRNRIKAPNGQPLWLTVPVVRELNTPINEVMIQRGSNWQRKHGESIKQAYSKAPHWDDCATELIEIYTEAHDWGVFGANWKGLINLNLYLTKWLYETVTGKPLYYNLSSRLRRVSQNGTATDRLIPLLRQVDATEYLANPGSMGYLEPERHKFTEAGIALKVFNFRHPVYPQIHGEFISHLSVLDLLFNTGPKAIDYIREGAKDAIC